ncbi:MAG TPA: oligosaccharide flippase family protein [Prolixibacteraceae bacterium]|jgi:O-antigen/teichoic acid export membrane protein|nr:oligosaccharide flippase family protein [Prolixibacteraceae bacterium]HRV88804.1 oligosaccharide flippase family protein [Prolixibacteraceae bacterium]
MNFRFWTKSKDNTIQAFWIVMGSLTTLGISLLSVAILSRYFSKEEYGTYRQIIYVYNTLMIVFTAGLPNVFSFYLPRYSLAQGKEIVFRISTILFYTGCVFSVFLFMFSGVIADILRNPELSRGLKYFSPVPALLLPTLGIEGIFSTYQKTPYIALYNVITKILLLVMVVFPVIFISADYLTAIWGWIAASVVILVITWFFKSIPFRGVAMEKPDLTLAEMLKFSLPLVTASIAGVTYWAANQFYVSRIFGPAVFAEFSNGFVEIPLVGMITGATSNVLMPLFSRLVHEKSEVSQITGLWRSALEKSAILIYPVVVFFLFFAREVVTLVYSGAYAVSVRYFLTAMSLNFFNIIIFAPLLISLGETRFLARLNYGLMALLWVTDYFLVLIFHSPLSLAIASVVIAVGGIAISIRFSSKKIGVPFFVLFPITRFLVIGLHSFLCLLVVSIFLNLVWPTLGDLSHILLAAAAYAGLLWGTARWFGIDYMGIIKPLLKEQFLQEGGHI